MNKKRIILVITVIAVLAASIAMLASCSSPLTLDDAYLKMTEAISKSATVTNYYNSVTYTNLDTNYTQNIRFQYIPDDSSTEMNETMIQFLDKTTPSYGAASIDNSYRFGYSLSKDIKSSKAKPEDYKPYMFKNENENGGKTYAKPGTEEEFMKGEKSGLFNPLTKQNDVTVKYQDMSTEDLLRDLGKIEKANITASDKDALKKESTFEGTNAFYQQGNVINMMFKVSQQGHPYDGLDVMVRILNGKINSIRFTYENNIKVQIDLIYNSPKLQLPNYDAKDILPWE